MADTGADERARLDVLSDLADRVGTCYEPGCLAACGNARFCRDRAFHAGTPTVAGTTAARLLPGIANLGRAEQLSHGAASTAAEAPAAELLERAGRLYDEASKEAAASDRRLPRRRTA